MVDHRRREGIQSQYLGSWLMRQNASSPYTGRQKPHDLRWAKLRAFGSSYESAPDRPADVCNSTRAIGQTNVERDNRREVFQKRGRGRPASVSRFCGTPAESRSASTGLCSALRLPRWAGPGHNTRGSGAKRPDRSSHWSRVSHQCYVETALTPPPDHSFICSLITSRPEPVARNGY